MNNLKILISSWHETPGTGGIYSYTLSKDGEPVQTGFSPLLCAGYMAFNSKKTVLYATCRINNDSDGAAAFIADGNNLSPLGKIIPSGGKSSCHISVSPMGNFIYTANYLSGTFSEYELNSDGSIKCLKNIIKHQGSGPNKERQEMPHPHCCVFTPDGKFLAVVDLGCDSVFFYPFSEKKGIDHNSPIINKLSPGCGPRHIIFDPDKPDAYLITELGNTLISYQYHNGILTLRDELLLLPRGVKYYSKASALRFSPDKKFLVCSNRGFDSIAIVNLDENGKISPAFLTLSGGSSPRDINFLNDFFFAAGNEFSDEVRFFDFDPQSAAMSPNGYKLDMPRPMCIMSF